MEISILKYEEVNRLQNDIETNLNQKRYGVFGFEKYLDPSKVVPLKDTEFDEDLFSQLDLKKGGAQDASNAKIIYESLKGLTPYSARDSRVWTYLAHTSGRKFAHRGISDIDDQEKKIEAINKEFFIKGNDARSYHSRHSLSKLWWAAHMCFNHSELPIDKALEVLCTQTDFRAQIMERTSTWPDSMMFRAMLNIANKRWNGSVQLSPFFQRKNGLAPYRHWNKLVNRHGGARLLSVLGKDAIEDLLENTAIQAQEKFDG
jgi:hypothetical protein